MVFTGSLIPASASGVGFGIFWCQKSFWFRSQNILASDFGLFLDPGFWGQAPLKIVNSWREHDEHPYFCSSRSRKIPAPFFYPRWRHFSRETRKQFGLPFRPSRKIPKPRANLLKMFIFLASPPKMIWPPFGENFQAQPKDTKIAFFFLGASGLRQTRRKTGTFNGCPVALCTA